jgi:hypothetical protein
MADAFEKNLSLINDIALLLEKPSRRADHDRGDCPSTYSVDERDHQNF